MPAKMFYKDAFRWSGCGGICSFFLGVLISIIPCSGFAEANVKLAWNPISDPIVAGFNIYYGGASGVYTNEVDAGTNTSLTISNFVVGATYYFAATTYSAVGAESSMSSEVSYTVPGSPVNQPPTLNPIANLTINENAGPQSVPFANITSGNPGQGQTLSVTASSSNPALIPNPTVTYTSPNASGSLAFAPAANASGSAVITVSVNNSGASNNVTSQSFTVTVVNDHTLPTLSITSPTLNQQCSNATFTAAGRAADNVAVASVLYSLNGGPWTNAVTANNWTNWSAPLPLVPGTNTLQAFALDTSGNASTTNSVRFEYVVLTPLSVQVFGLGVPNPKWGFLSSGYYPGWGWLPGDTNGTRLAVNETYALTAVASPGFAFTNWSDGNGNRLTNGPTLRFTMATNLALVANFVDVTRPTLSITSPTLNQQCSNATFTAAGRAADNVAVASVLYSLNGGPWTNAVTANNWTNWSAPLPLVPGTNTLQAFALDTSGNASTTNSVRFEYVVLTPLSVQVFGLGVPNPKWGFLSSGYYPGWGWLPGDTNGTRLAVNETYALTAVASPGFAFTNWSDGNGNRLTNGPTLRFTMATNLALVANFVDVTRPTLSITSPTLNQQCSNATFTAAGRAADNVAVASVLYSLNGGPWTNAVTANNWTNWSAPLPLVPGTNTLQAFALDTSGNASTTNSVRFEYVVLTPLSVQVFGLGVPNPKWGFLSSGYYPGWGWLPGDTNGTRLAVNETYALTAVASPGFAFTNWSDGNGNRLTNGPTLRFTMATNLALVANFVDVTRPTLSITSPTLNQQCSNATFTAAGRAADNVAVASVLYSLNGGPWTNAVTANNWTNWSAPLPLVPGTNTLQAFALDTSGNASTTNSVRFEYVVLTPLSVQVFGLGVPNPKWGFLSSGYYPGWGWLPGDTNGTRLAVNETYALTAVASPGFAFTNWSDGNGNRLTNGPTLRFTMATNLALVANFVDVTRPTLSITSPTLNQQCSNATFTAAGRAADNVAVASVLYSLNGGPWTNATTANNWTNWSAPLPLVPGTNTLQAFALDTSGNASTTNSVRFEYVVLTPLSVQVFGLGVPNPKWGFLSSGYYPGWGWLPGDTNGTRLAVNETYALTAVASPGFAFTNWSDGNGNRLTNGPTLRFTMATNLALVANFVDVTRPTLSITSPTLNQQCSNATFTAAGRAADNVAVASVLYSLNGGPWTNATTANNWTNWSAPLPLVPGTNTLQAFALDTSGNASTTNSVRFEYVGQQSLVAQAAKVIAPLESAVLSPASFANGQFALTVLGDTNVECVVQASTNLVDWVPVLTNTAPFTFVDSNAAQFSQRYYRTVYAQ